ncbi:MAG: transcription termination factor NusA [Peptococcaceae bacterium]|nr:transcription termination factor NusA [Peptococcaceae bacterium]
MNKEFILALKQLEKEKGIDAQVILDAIEAALISAYKKNYGSLMNVSVHMNQETGEFEVFATKEVVDDVHSPQTEISLEDAKAFSLHAELGDLVEVPEYPKNFGRIAAQTAKQVVVQRIREAERGVIYDEFTNKESEIISGVIERIEAGSCYLKLNKAEAVLPPQEQIPNEEYYVNKRIKACILEVKKAQKGPQVIVSRSNPKLLVRLFELEVPEIKDGFVVIKSVAREAGMRSKIAVQSLSDEIDAVGSCVGPNGARVKAIVDELCGEKIDIINWDESPDIYIAEALSPSLVIDVLIDEENKKAVVVVPDNQLSLAIGKEGQNARLAAKLTNWKIDIKNQSQANEQGIEYNYIFCDEDDCLGDSNA